MNLVFAYKRTGAISAGNAVCYNAATGSVSVSAEKTGIFAGVYGYVGNPSIGADDPAGEIGVTVAGPVKVLVDSDVAAFDFGVLDSGGALRSKTAADTAGKVAGYFLEDGSQGEYVDFYVSPSMIGAAVGG